MMKKSSSSENEPCCTKACKKNTDKLNSKITELSDKLDDKVNMIYHYSLGLSQVEGRLVEQKERELKYLEKIRTLEYYNESYKECTETLKKKLETLQSDKNKEGLGYSAVLPPIAQIYTSPKKDLSWTGLPEFADDTVTDYSRPLPTIEICEEADKETERPTIDKVKTDKKPAVKYAKLYRKPSKKPTVRGNQRNWNNLKSQQLGVKIGRSSPKNNYTHRSMPPRPTIHRPYRPLMRTTRPNSNAATRPYVNSKRPQTTQELMSIMIQRVQRLERELKARTPVHKVDRGRSRPVMAWVTKKSRKRSYPRNLIAVAATSLREDCWDQRAINSRNLIADATSSLGEDCWELNVQGIPTASEEFSHC
nr:hypothetical protein [Tanacetum cinerariifolium]